MDKIAVVIPCYNEGETIGRVVRDFKMALPEAVVYVYDNNSSDDTAALAREAGAVVRREYQQGKGNVIRRMFREIHAQCYVMVDGDATYPANAAREMTDLVLNRDVDMVVGDRLSSTYFSENHRPLHGVGNTLVRLAINKLFGSDIKDMMTGYRAFSYRFVKTFPVMSTGFEIETEMSIHAVDKHLRVENVIIDYKDRPAGSTSKLRTIPDGLKVLKTILYLYMTYKPLRFFSVVATILTLLGTGFFIPVFVKYLATGKVGKLPTLIVCGLSILAAIQCFFTGLILSNLHYKDRSDFEKDLIRVEAQYQETLQREGRSEF